MKNSKRIDACLKSGVVVTLIVGSYVASADDWEFVFQPRVSVGIGDYSLESGTFEVINQDGDKEKGLLSLDLNGSIDGFNNINIRSPLIGIGTSVAYGPFYVDLYYQQLLRDNNNSSCNDVISGKLIVCADGSLPPTAPDWRESYSQVKADRGEYVVALGYSINDVFGVFTGYRNAEMDWEQSRRDSDSFQVDRKGSFELDGPFVGLSIKLTSEEMPGVLLLKGAYGRLDGTLQTIDRWSWEERGIESQRITTGIDGKADAYSIGLFYNSKLFDSDRWIYAVGVDYQYFDFDMSNGYSRASEGALYKGYKSWEKGQVAEEMFSVRFNLSYVF